MTKPSKMNTFVFKRIAVLVAGLVLSIPTFASTGGDLLQAGTDLEDRASLQRGAQLYMNNCVGCHSLKYIRYSRIAEDFGLSEEQVMNSMNFTGAKLDENVISAMP